MWSGALLAMLLLSAAAWAQTDQPSPKEAIVTQQMHGYLDALIDLQLKLLEARQTAAKREKEWADYSQPLWHGEEHADQQSR
jgi:hypothetical protein